MQLIAGAGSYVLTLAESSPALVAQSTAKDVAVTVAGAVETRAGRSRFLPTGAPDPTERTEDGSGDGIETRPDFRPLLGSPDGMRPPGALGVFAWTVHGAEVRVAVAATGSVTTYGDQADGVRLAHRGETATHTEAADGTLAEIPVAARTPGRLVAEIAGAVRTMGAGAAALRAPLAAERERTGRDACAVRLRQAG